MVDIRRDFFLDLPDLPQTLGQLQSQIPVGSVTTYGSLARALGDILASRWVGQYGLAHLHRPDCPCHRVIRSTGQLGGYISGNVDDKRRRLVEEGIAVDDGKIDLATYRFDDFQGDTPLEELRKVQQHLLGKLSLSCSCRRPSRIGGVDVSYAPDGRAVAAYALVDCASGQLVWSTSIVGRITFPYIPSCLAFRELPILLELIKRVRQHRRVADCLMVDGSGILHQRRAGIATLLGIMADLPTIGVTKKLLCGQVDIAEMHHGEIRSVVEEETVIGTALCSGRASSRPLYISPGQGLTVGDSTSLVIEMLQGHRLPEPIYWADRLSRQYAHRLATKSSAPALPAQK